MQKYSLEIKWGIIFIAVSLIWMLFEKMAGLHGPLIDKHPIYTNLFAIPAILLFVFALRDKRKNFYHGSMTWKQGFIAGLIISLIVAILSPLGQIITHKLISPEYFTNAINYGVEHRKMTQEQGEAYFNIKSYMLQSAIGGLVMGLVTSAIVAVFVRKR